MIKDGWTKRQRKFIEFCQSGVLTAEMRLFLARDDIRVGQLLNGRDPPREVVHHVDNLWEGIGDTMMDALLAAIDAEREYVEKHGD